MCSKSFHGDGSLYDFEAYGAREVVADLDCVIVDPTDEAYEVSGAVILCHGFGAPGTDLVNCCQAMWQLQPNRLSRVRFVFPTGPLALDESGLYDSRAWWMIDMEQLNRMMETGEFRDLRHESPPELARCRESIVSLVEWVRTGASLQSQQIVVGGFSQGAMLATDVALRLKPACGGLIIWSGTLLCEDQWRGAAKAQHKFPIFQSHGRSDPILPFPAAIWLKEMLIDSGFEVEFNEFAGLHEIPMPALRGAAELAARVAGI